MGCNHGNPVCDLHGIHYYQIIKHSLITKSRLIGQKELAKTATIVENSMVVAVLSCFKQDTPWTKRVGKNVLKC